MNEHITVDLLEAHLAAVEAVGTRLCIWVCHLCHVDLKEEGKIEAFYHYKLTAAI